MTEDDELRAYDEAQMMAAALLRQMNKLRPAAEKSSLLAERYNALWRAWARWDARRVVTPRLAQLLHERKQQWEANDDEHARQ